VRKEFKIALLIVLLAQSSRPAWTQEDNVSDEDLQTLLEDKGPETEAAAEAVVAPADPIAVEAPAEAVEAKPATPPAEDTSSETVNLDTELENLDGEADPVDSTAVIEEATPPVATSEELPVIEPLEDKKEEKAADFQPATGDDLDSITKDLGPEEKVDPPSVEKVAEKPDSKTEVFDVGREERELLAVARNIQGQISDNEWNEVATAAKVDSYTVIKNDWLFKISKRIFGTGYYYPKIWSLNTYIVNPHYIEPGMILSFTTGSGNSAPEFKLGAFTQDELDAVPGSIGNSNPEDIDNFGEGAKPAWLDEKKDMEKQGIYFQYASDETMDDLQKASQNALNKEYENYEPPRSDFEVVMPKNYDKQGFDKNSKIYFSFKEGYYLSTFISTNIVQDFGSVENGPDENIFFTTTDRAYIKLDETINALPGDRFSVYTTSGKIKQKNSDREGYKYTIVGQIKLLRKIRDKWEVEFTEVAGTPQRGDRITAYTPKIERITHTYNTRLIEAAIMTSFQPQQSIMGFGDVVYLDRGRADGVEMGNTFDVYEFKDRGLKTKITDQPTYKVGELTVITLTDNFATAIVSKSNRDFYAGDIAITKTKEAHLREMNARKTNAATQKEMMGGKALEELDVELNLDGMNDDLLKEADKIQLTEDELAELERQEREKSVIKDSERDLKSLERLENEIENAESILNDAKLDEDKLLENENLNDIEKKKGNVDQDSLDEIEENLGKRYIDEDLNSKDNPYGLTEFDVEEVDELLNVEKKQQK
jgi:nucleoid-associated protein YgaU